MAHPEDNYRIENLVLGEGKDSIKQLQFYFKGKDPNAQITVSYIEVKHPLSIKSLKALRKHYQEVI